MSTILFAFAGASVSFAQIHLAPVTGADGIPGLITRSFIIKWAPFDSVDTYEYIMSDNPLCFSGCPGDTRQRFTGDTSATEYNLQEDVWYYWITRMYLMNGDTTFWTPISSFLAKTPPESEPDELINVAPNPSSENGTVVKIDWAVNPNAKKIRVLIYSILGLPLFEIEVEKSVIRYQDYYLSLPTISKGTYIAVFIVDDNPNNPNNRITKKLILE